MSSTEPAKGTEEYSAKPRCAGGQPPGPAAAWATADIGTSSTPTTSAIGRPIAAGRAAGSHNRTGASWTWETSRRSEYRPRKAPMTIRAQ